MEVNIIGVHYHISEATHNFIIEKLERLKQRKILSTLEFKITKNSDSSYDLMSSFHFNWKQHEVIEAKHETVLYAGVEKIIDKITVKVDKAHGQHNKNHHDHDKKDRHHGIEMINSHED